jgi:hypothetical protein
MPVHLSLAIALEIVLLEGIADMISSAMLKLIVVYRACDRLSSSRVACQLLSIIRISLSQAHTDWLSESSKTESESS